MWFNCDPHHAANTSCSRFNAWVNHASKLAGDDRNSIIGSWIRRCISCYMPCIMHVCDIETWKEIFVGWTTIQWWFRSTLLVLRKLINLKAFMSLSYLEECTSHDKYFLINLLLFRLKYIHISFKSNVYCLIYGFVYFITFRWT